MPVILDNEIDIELTYAGPRVNVEPGSWWKDLTSIYIVHMEEFIEFRHGHESRHDTTSKISSPTRETTANDLAQLMNCLRSNH